MIETYEEAIDFVCNYVIDEKTVTEPFFHFGVGMQIRNGLDLWKKESPLHKHMLERFGLCHADDTYMLISNAAHAKKNGQTYSPDEDVKRCKDHWRNYGLDPATMEKIQ